VTNTQSFVAGFRNSAPYINALRSRTLVISFGGEAVIDEKFPNFIHDIALLNSLGIRLVLVHGARPQIARCLKEKQISSEFINNLRVTNAATMNCVKQAVGNVRVEIEALMSMGLANSPMAGAKIRVISGNFMTARPLGVINGVDHDHTGEVRRIDHVSIHSHLANGEIVLLSPIGYSPTGEILNVNAEDVASAAAIELKADKLIYLTENQGIKDNRKKIIPALQVSEAESLLNKKKKSTANKTNYLEKAVHACRNDVNRVHIIDRHLDGALIQELFTRDGIGTLISADTYEGLRPATIDDVGGILELISPLESKDVLVRRSRDHLELEINHFTVVERDGAIIACSALYPSTKENVAELACLAVHPDYQNTGRGNILFEYMERQAREMEIKKLFVLTTQTAHWFRERGFKSTDIKSLPVKRKNMYNYKRNSKVYVKTL
jgi:amino-acid N-acetyltransferase